MTLVIKVGGSLLDLPDLKERVTSFIANLRTRQPILLVTGGGEIVEAVRKYDAIHQLNSEQAHWLSVELMHATSKLLESILAIGPVLDSAEQLSKWLSPKQQRAQEDSLKIVSPRAYYTRTLNRDQLPISWETTSDTISLLLATIVQAEELILLKSADTNVEVNLSDLADRFWEKTLDCSFKPTLEKNASQLPRHFRVRIVNLRTWGV